MLVLQLMQQSIDVLAVVLLGLVDQVVDLTIDEVFVIKQSLGNV